MDEATSTAVRHQPGCLCREFELVARDPNRVQRHTFFFIVTVVILQLLIISTSIALALFIQHKTWKGGWWFGLSLLTTLIIAPLVRVMRAEQRKTKALFRRVREWRERRDAIANRALRTGMELAANRASAVRRQSIWSAASTLWDEENVVGLGIAQEEPVESQGGNNQMGDDESEQLPRSNSRSSATAQEAQYVVMRRVERSEERLSGLEPVQGSPIVSIESDLLALRGSSTEANAQRAEPPPMNDSGAASSTPPSSGFVVVSTYIAPSPFRRTLTNQTTEDQAASNNNSTSQNPLHSDNGQNRVHHNDEESIRAPENNPSARPTIRARRGLSGISVNILAESLESQSESEQGASSGRDKGVMSADEVNADSVGTRESFRNVAPYSAT